MCVCVCVCVCVCETVVHGDKPGKHGYCPLAIHSWLEAEAQVRQLGEQLKAEKNVQLSTTLLASGLTDKVGEQNNKLETFACHFAEWGGQKAPWIKVWVLSENLWQRASLVKSACQCRRHMFDPWVRKIPGEGNDNPLQYFCLGNPVDRGVWWAVIHGVSKESNMT